MKQCKRIVVLCIAVALIGLTCAMTMKADIGLGAYDANTKLFSNITSIQVGTVSIIVNSLCVLVQFIILKKDFTVFHLAQVPISIFLGVVINFAYYTLLEPIVLTTYMSRVIMFTVGIIGCSFAVGIVMVLDIVTMALEGACMAVAGKTGKKFHVIRQLVDVVLIVFVLGFCFIGNMDMILREGTIISALIFGPSMGFFMFYQKKAFKRLGLLK